MINYIPTSCRNGSKLPLETHSRDSSIVTMLARSIAVIDLFLSFLIVCVYVCGKLWRHSRRLPWYQRLRGNRLNTTERELFHPPPLRCLSKWLSPDFSYSTIPSNHPRSIRGDSIPLKKKKKKKREDGINNNNNNKRETKISFACHRVQPVWASLHEIMREEWRTVWPIAR